MERGEGVERGDGRGGERDGRGGDYRLPGD